MFDSKECTFRALTSQKLREGTYPTPPLDADVSSRGVTRSSIQEAFVVCDLLGSIEADKLTGVCTANLEKVEKAGAK